VSPIVSTYAYDGRGRLAYSSLPAYNAPQPECLTGIGTADSSCTPQYGSFTLFDGINRPVSVAAAGGALSATQYMADETLVSDPAGVTRLNTATARQPALGGGGPDLVVRRRPEWNPQLHHQLHLRPAEQPDAVSQGGSRRAASPTTPSSAC